MRNVTTADKERRTVMTVILIFSRCAVNVTKLFWVAVLSKGKNVYSSYRSQTVP